MKDPQSLVLVAEDLVDDDEAEGEYPALKTASVYRPVAAPAGSKIVVGVASLQLKPGSVYKATFQPVCELIGRRFCSLDTTLTRTSLHGRR